MPHKSRIRQESLKEVLRHHFTDKVGLMVILVAILAVGLWNPEPSAEEVNKRRELINKQVTQELVDCINGDVNKIVSVFRCRPLKKGAVIWVR